MSCGAYSTHAERVTRVFDERNTMRTCGGSQRFHIAGKTVQMNGKSGANISVCFRTGFLERLWRENARCRIGIGENHFRPGHAHHIGRRKKRDRGHDRRLPLGQVQG